MLCRGDRVQQQATQSEVPAPASLHHFSVLAGMRNPLADVKIALPKLLVGWPWSSPGIPDLASWSGGGLVKCLVPCLHQRSCQSCHWTSRSEDYGMNCHGQGHGLGVFRHQARFLAGLCGFRPCHPANADNPMMMLRLDFPVPCCQASAFDGGMSAQDQLWGPVLFPDQEGHGLDAAEGCVATHGLSRESWDGYLTPAW